MPSPVAHALAGIGVAWTADLVGVRQRSIAAAGPSWWAKAGGGCALACAGLAAAPDLDLLVGAHRGISHSLGAAVTVGFLAAAVACVVRRLSGKTAMGRPIVVAWIAGCAYGTHILLDWLSADHSPPYGIMALWPLSHRWFQSGWDLFADVDRTNWLTLPVMRHNLIAAAGEVAIMALVLVPLWSVRIKALTRFSAETTGSDHPPQ